MDGKKIQINLKSVEDILEFVSITEKCDFEIYINAQEHNIVNGKSLLGLCTVIGYGNLNVLYNGESKSLSAMLDKFHI